MPSNVKSIFLGKAIRNEESAHQRLSNPVGLAVFSSDALSSTAYATGEILLILAVAGTGALKLSWPIALAIGMLLIVVVTSYRQTIKAYPKGGGSYRVASDNLGIYAGLVAGAALLVDYTLTVAVSVSAGTAAVTSALPDLKPFQVEIAVGFVVLLALANLRGVKESGALFAVPTYGFVGLMILTILTGFFRYFTLGPESIAVPVPAEIIATTAPLTLFLVLKAFASGCAALSGIEAIADGVAVFREPTAKNARLTLTWMAGILLFLFLGLSWLAVHAGVQASHETVISQLSRTFFGTGPLYFVISAFTAAILVVAANTAYADFPRLASFMAADDFLPHQLRDLGHRLVFSKGIIALTLVAIALIIGFNAETSLLIPLYALGVFTCFTLSQAGMVMRWVNNKEPGWKHNAAINGLGALVTFIVLGVVTVTKFRDGAWIVVLLVPLMCASFLWVRRQYKRVAAELALAPDELVDLNYQAYNRIHNHVVVLVKNIDRRLVRALQYTRTLRADEIEALYVDSVGEGRAAEVQKMWDQAGFGIKFTIVESPYREVLQPIIDRVRAIPRPSKDYVVTVIVPEYAPANAADGMLHDQTSFWIKRQLFGEPGVIVVDVPYHPSFDDDEPIEETTAKV